MTVQILLTIALLLSIVIPFGAFYFGERSKGRYKKSLAFNVLTFFGLIIVGQFILFTGDVQAAEVAANGGLSTGLGYLAAALSTGLSCVGGGIAVASAASAALGAISEDGSILGKSLIFVGLAEGVCLYGLIISFMILGKL